ncbi:hypothetical protein KR067_006064 [Drosophila pandora]|nr:hypothetical protein KR067_006064 [Drosophila pandora]
MPENVSIFLSGFLILFNCVFLAAGYKYQFSFSNYEIFQNCQNQKSMVFGIDRLFDMSEFRISFNKEVLTIGGNLTSIWDLDAFDRVVFTIDTYKLERGTWQPTIFSVKSYNFCNDMYGKNFYWYTYWTQYITNKNEVKHLCLLPGTKLKFQEYKVNVIVDIPNVNLNGVYKLQYILQAYDLIGRKRPTSLCFEVRGEYTKIRTN